MNGAFETNETDAINGPGMAKRKSHEDAECPVARTLDAIGDSWSLLIIRDAFNGVRRFGEFQKNLGMAKNILAARLRKLVAHGILQAIPASDGSAYQEYVLSAKGCSLFHVIVGLREWGETYCFRPGEAHSILVDRVKDRPVGRLELRACDGRLLGPADARVKMIDELDRAKPAARRGRTKMKS
jgi:DNA-binding HxlR family transcriptional regulator